MKDVTTLQFLSEPERNSNTTHLDNDATIVSGTSPEDINFTPEELGQRLGIPSDDRMSNYQNLHAIGLGGVGAVYAGYEPGTNREVAIKILRPQYRFSTERIESFVREARATAQIDHPNIVPVYRFGVFENEGIYFSMKRVRGETLRNVLRKLSENQKNYSRRYTLRRLVDIFIAACNGVAFANKNGVFHGDLKPGNIMIGEFGEVLVMDWGMARYRSEFDTAEGKKKIHLGTPDELRLEKAMTENADTPIGGTPVFMAPEHLTGEEKKLTETSEVYALGTILYCILTWKQAPYDTDQPRGKIIQQVVRSRLPSPRRIAPQQQPVPLELEAICRKAMNKNPALRYSKVSEMIDELQNYLDGYPVKAYSPSPLYYLGKWLNRHPIVPVTFIALSLGIGGFKFYTLMQDKAEQKSRFRLAEYNAEQAFAYSTAVRNHYRILKNTANLEFDKRFKLFRDVNKYTSLMANSYAMALSSLSLLPRTLDNARSQRQILAREIFRNSIAVYRELGETPLLQETILSYRKRWGSLFVEVLKDDPELLRMILLTESGRGFLKIENTADKKWQFKITDTSGNTPDISGQSLDNLQLPSRDYTVKFSHPSKGSFNFPVRIYPGKTAVVSPGFPEKIPTGMCYIGAGEIPIYDLIHFQPGGNIPPFFISKHEVSIGEYLKFWHSLPEQEKEKHTAITSISPDGTSRKVWDTNGVLRPPYRKEHPVAGLSAESAKAYCRWLSKQLNCNIRLPDIAEWRKAAFRFDETHINHGIFYSSRTEKLYPAGAFTSAPSGDISAYGVVNAYGNVREIMINSLGKTHHVTGGSFLTSGTVVDRRRIQFTISGENDIGFRYVMELPSAEKN